MESASEVILVVQALVVAMPAAWLSVGVIDNILHPHINRDDVAKVLALEALRDFPEIRSRLEHRAITNPAIVRLLFTVMVMAETISCVILWAGSACLVGALFGFCDAYFAREMAILGAASFVGIWASFLIGGQWFYYWYAQFGQTTHFLATLWGLGVLLVLLA
jgi:predicted small integral membrane protein